MVEVKIIDISLSNLGFVILLQALKQEKTLPIFIGIPEAQAIAIQYNNIETSRPLTHDLFKNILTILNCKVNKVIIDDYKDHSYYAKVFFESEDEHYQVDSRPSDAIALALKFEVPIYVESNIMDSYSIILKKEKADQESIEEINNDPNYKERLINRKTEIEILKEKLRKAIEEERYEDAAFIRDELKKYEEGYNFKEN